MSAHLHIPDHRSTDFLTSLIAQHSMVNMPMETWLRWGIVLLLIVAVLWWHHRQNSTFRNYLQSQSKASPLSTRLCQLASTRSLELFGALSILFLTLLFYDTRINQRDQYIFFLQSQLADRAQVITAHEAQIAAQKKALKAASINEMTEAQQDALDMLKPQFENLFINYYYLRACDSASTQDFHLMNSALMYELNRLDAPANLRRNILQAAKGSYEELYALHECNPREMAPMKERVRTYLDTIANTLPDE